MFYLIIALLISFTTIILIVADKESIQIVLFGYTLMIMIILTVLKIYSEKPIRLEKNQHQSDWIISKNYDFKSDTTITTISIVNQDTVYLHTQYKLLER